MINTDMNYTFNQETYLRKIGVQVALILALNSRELFPSSSNTRKMCSQNTSPSPSGKTFLKSFIK